VGRRSRPPPLPTLVEGVEEYQVEKILNSRHFRNQLQFLVKWEGYGYEHNEWVADSEVHAPLLVRDFYRSHPGAPRRIQSASFHSIRFHATNNYVRRGAAPYRGGDVRGRPSVALQSGIATQAASIPPPLHHATHPRARPWHNDPWARLPSRVARP
jgi:hypothetical protein